jgi:hypothetical protein
MQSFKQSFTALAVAGLAVVGGAAQAATVHHLTFDEFAVGTVISNQYAAQGVVFNAGTGALPIIANDGAMPDSPVLSPNPPYAGAFEIDFITSTTWVQFNSGYWDTLGTAVINVYDKSDTFLLGTYTNTQTAQQTFTFSNAGGIGRITFDSFADPAGGDIDDLKFNVPEPGTLLLAGLALAGALRVNARRKAA